jgi:aminoglycoside/choline kinase family phosphotransferase
MHQTHHRMTDHSSLQELRSLFIHRAGAAASECTLLHTGSGSGRVYYRLASENFSAVGTVNRNIQENNAFLSLSAHFRSHGLPVPEIYGVGKEGDCYLQEDFGDRSLLDHLNTLDEAGKEERLKDALLHLAAFQIKGAQGLDFRLCYPGHDFDIRTARWDLDYFKYMFLKPLDAEMDEAELDTIFDRLLDHLFGEYITGFMYRDFQSRNILVRHNRLWFIDYQGGRRGPLLYDAASLLYHTRLSLEQPLRDRLSVFYGEVVADYLMVDRVEMTERVQEFALLRLLQTLGAYGFRGLYERKEAFVKPIGDAIKNTLQVMHRMPASLPLQHLSDLLEDVSPRFAPHTLPDKQLRITLNSFSFMYGLPVDNSGNGGGFVFDCRALPNPHHEPHLRPLNGTDAPIREWLADKEVVVDFLSNCESLVISTVQRYISRGFTNLQVNFGCTGGKHRSVFCVETLAARLNKRGWPCVVEKHHTMLNNE